MILVVRKERIIFCFSLKKFLKLPLNYTGQDKIILGYEASAGAGFWMLSK